MVIHLLYAIPITILVVAAATLVVAVEWEHLKRLWNGGMMSEYDWAIFLPLFVLAAAAAAILIGALWAFNQIASFAGLS